MNSRQRRCLSRLYVQKAKEELKDVIFHTDMEVNNNEWVYCRFESKIHNHIYILCLQTAKHRFNSQLFDLAYDNIIANGDHSQEQASDYILKAKLEMKRILDANDADAVYEQFIQMTPFRKRLGRKFIDAVIDVPYIEESDIIQLIQQFWQSNETYWQSSTPILFSKEQLGLN